MAVRCPRCRREIGFEQVTHAACGWRAGTAQPGSPEERHAREDAARAKPEVVEANMKAIRETLGCKTARNLRLSPEERRGGAKLSKDERVIAKTQEEYDVEVARLKAEDRERAAKRERLRKIAEGL